MPRARLSSAGSCRAIDREALATIRRSSSSLAQLLESLGRVTFHLHIVASAAKKRSSGVGQDVTAWPAAVGGRPVEASHLRPDVFDIVWRKWDVVGEAVGESKALPIGHHHKGIGT